MRLRVPARARTGGPRPLEPGQVSGALLESFRKIAIAAGRGLLLPDGMAIDPPPGDVSPAFALLDEGAGMRRRLAVAGRVVLAALGGYGIAALATALFALVLPLPRPDAVSAATQLSFAVMASTVVFVFAAATLRRAALALSGIAGILAAGLWLAGGFLPSVPA